MATNNDKLEEVKPIAPTEQTEWRDPSLVGKYIVDPKTGLAGLFRSPDNGESWVLTDTVYGHVYNQNEVDNIWNNGTADKVKQEVDSATAEIPNIKSTANEAVKKADSAIAASKANADAHVAMNSAISAAQEGVNSANAAIQQVASNATSDAAQIRADVAQIQKEIDTSQSANSASVEKLKSDISSTQNNLDVVRDNLSKAQSAVEQNQKLINDSVADINGKITQDRADIAAVQEQLTGTQTSISNIRKDLDSNVAQIETDIAQVQKDVAQDRKDITTVQGQLTSAQSSIADTRKALDSSVADINGKITQDRKDIVAAQQANTDTAKKLDSYANQAVEQGKTIKTIQDKQDGFSATIADVKGNVSKVSDTVDGLSAGLKDAQGNIASVKAQADQLNATLTDHSKNITQLTATTEKISSTLEDASGRLSKVEQTTAEHSTTLSDLQGNLSQVKQTADGLVATVKDVQGNITQIKQDAAGTLEQLSNAQSDITTLQKNVSGIKLTIADHDKNIHTLQADSKALKDNMADAQGNISSLQKTSTSLTSEIQDHSGRLSKVEQTANGIQQTAANQQGQINTIKTDAAGIHQTLTGQGNQIATINTTLDGLNTKYEGVSGDLDKLRGQARWENVMDAVDLNSIKTPCHKFLKGTVTNAPNEAAWWYLTVESVDSSRVIQTVIADQSCNRYTRRWNGEEWSPWVKGTTQTDVTDLSNRITANSTQIAQNKNSIALKADQSAVDNLSGKVDEKTAQLKLQADSINATVTDQGKNISSLQTTAKETSSTLSTVQGNLSQVKQTADGLVTTVKGVQGNVSQLQQTAKGTTEQISNIQGDITNLQTDVTGVKATIAGHDKSIHTLQADSKTLKDDMADTKGNISSLQKTSTSLTSEMQDHSKRLSKVEQTAGTLTTEFSAHDGRLSKIEQTANGIQQTVADQQGQINTIKTDANGIHATLTGQGSQIATINTALSGLNTKYEGVEQSGNELKNRLNNLKVGTSNLLHNSDTFDGWIKGSSVSVTADKYLNGRIAILGGAGVNGGQLTTDLEGPYDNQPVTWTVYAKADNAGDKLHTELWGGRGLTEQPLTTEWQVYKFTGQRDTRNHGFYLWGCAGNRGNIYVALPFAVVGNTIGTWSPNPSDIADKITANSTQIYQNKNLIGLKADQSTVDNLSGKVSQNTSQLNVQADQISSKVSSADFNALDDKVNGMKIGGKNLLKGTRDLNSRYWYCSDSSHSDLAGNPIDSSVKEIHSFADWASFRYNQTIQLDPNKDYMVSADIAIYGGDGDGLYVTAYGNLDDAGIALTNDFNLAGFPKQQNGEGFKRVYLPLKTHGKKLDTFRIEGHGDWRAGAGSVFISKISLYEGNAQQGWEDSSDDLIESIQSNTTAIDQNKNQISLKADQTEVDTIKNTASNNSSRLDVMAGEIRSKVTSTDVNNIVDSKGYATTSSVQSLITQSAGKINESITNLTGKVNSNNGGGINLVSGTIEDIVLDDTANTGTRGWCFHVLPLNAELKVGDKITVSADVTLTGKGDLSQWSMSLWSKDIVDMRSDNYSADAKKGSTATLTITSIADASKPTVLLIYCGRVGDTEGKKAVFHHLKAERGSVATPWSPAPSDNATVTQIQSVTASIDGLQSNVTNYQNDTSSKFTQLSSLVQSKVSQSDFNSKVTQLASDINLRVTKGDLLSQINLTAGNTLIQSNKIYLDADSVVFGANSRAFIPSAAIENLDASKLTFYGTDNTYATVGASIAQYDDDKVKNTINLQYNGGIELHSANNLGSILTMHDDTVRLAVKSNGTADAGKPTDQYSGFYVAPGYTLLNSYQNDGTVSGISVGSTDSGANKDYRINIYDGSKSDSSLSKGVQVAGSRFDTLVDTSTLHARNWISVQGNTDTWLVGGNQRIHLHPGEIVVENPTDSSTTAVHMIVHGWASYDGYVEAMGWTTKSTLSSKTRIQPLDTAKALDTINATDLTTYQYKSEVAEGMTKRHAGLVIDDVHDVAQYSTPDAFVAENHQGRSDADIVGYLMGAVQELSKQLNKIKEKVKL